MTKPSKDYCFALIGETIELFKEYQAITSGNKELSPEDKARWNEKKERLHEQIKQVRDKL